MKLTFACDKCGTVLLESLENMAEYSDYWSFYTTPVCPKCPKCDQPSFGALTAEMVAEALCDSVPKNCSWADWGNSSYSGDYTKDDFRAMARFVLRLLDGLEGGKPTRRSADDWRACLLEIARQP